MMNNKTAELIKLINENPELPILPMVASEIVCDDGYNYWIGSFGSCYVGEYAYYNDHFYTDRDDLEEEYYDRNYDEYADMTDEEAEIDIKAKTEHMWTKAILVYIDLPE